MCLALQAMTLKEPFLKAAKSDAFNRIFSALQSP